MRGRPPLTRWSAASAGAALVISLAAWARLGGGMFSAGPLHAGGAEGSAIGGIRAHAELSDDCGACHAPPWDAGGMAERCLACHREIDRELPDTTRLHGAIRSGAECLACHTEHGGPTAPLTRHEIVGDAHDRFGFSVARHRTRADGQPFTCDDCHAGTFGFPDDGCIRCHGEYQPAFTVDHAREWGRDCRSCHDGSGGMDGSAFDHAATGFPLEGEHAAATCADCHGDASSRADLAATPTGCIECHRDSDAHDGGMGPDCGACHDARDWGLVDFDHRFPLDHGRRQAGECAVCHQDAPTAYATYTCYGCHDHSPGNVRSEHLEEGIRDFRDCVGCHPTGREEEGEHGGDRDD